jgi:uncharacterized protein (TIGR01777 family)
MKVIITGGSGFIGTNLARRLKARGDEPVILDISEPRIPIEYHKVNLAASVPEPEIFECADAVVHLAGANIAARWTPEYKKLIRDSRILAARNVIGSIRKCKKAPRAFISASAVGYYGDRGDEILTESCAPGSGFLADVCREWEAEAKTAEALGLKVSMVRTAPVLGQGGMLAKILPLFRIGLGGRIGLGRKWFPWIHMDDLLAIYIGAVDGKISGAVNASPPAETSNVDFARALGRALHRPALFPVPELALKLMMGESAAVALYSQRVRPALLLQSGWKFSFPELYPALRDVLS